MSTQAKGKRKPKFSVGETVRAGNRRPFKITSLTFYQEIGEYAYFSRGGKVGWWEYMLRLVERAR